MEVDFSMARVLIVDDSKTSRNILRSIIENAGHEVVAEGVDGEDGFIKFREFRPDIVTLDITMPKMNGIEVLKLIKHEDDDVKIIMITSAGKEKNILEAVKAGASDFITKPFVDEEIIKVING